MSVLKTNALINWLFGNQMDFCESLIDNIVYNKQFQELPKVAVTRTEAEMLLKCSDTYQVISDI